MFKSLRIAVAEDERDMRDFLEKALSRLGHQVLGPVQNGAELVQLCHNQSPDLIITDIRMPEMNGDDALREIFDQKRIPYIVISAFEVPELGTALQGVPSVYLNKPVRMNDLKSAIEQIGAV